MSKPAEAVVPKEPDVIVEWRVSRDPHAQQKEVELVAYVEGSPNDCHLTQTIMVTGIVSKTTDLRAKIEKMRADAREYFANFNALSDIEQTLADLGVRVVKQESGSDDATPAKRG